MEGDDDVRPVKILVALALAAGTLAAAARLTAAPAALKTTELGQGPPVVLVHGLGGSGLQWMPTARKLLAGHKVVMLDLPGHGDSPMTDPFSLDEVAESLDGVLAKHPGAIVVGHGFGGLVSLATLRRHPDHVRGLVLIDAAAKFTVPVPDQQQKMFLEYIDTNYPAFLKQMFTRLGRDSAQGVEIHAQASLTPKASMLAYMRTLLNVDEAGVLKNPPVPVLYVGSSKAWPDTVAWADVARQRGYPDPAKVGARRIGDSGYLLMKDQPDSLAAVIAEFVKGAGAKQ
jgi:pimeloyl-ACP methyl ester carboxylesterase